MNPAAIAAIIQAVSAIIQAVTKLIDSDKGLSPEAREALRHETMKLVERAKKLVKP